MNREIYVICGITSFLIGIAIPFIIGVSLLPIFLILFVSFLILYLIKVISIDTYILLIVITISLIFGYMRSYILVQEENRVEPQEDTLTIEGVVVKEPREKDISKTLEVFTPSLNTKILINNFPKHSECSYGDKITFTGNIFIPTILENDIGIFDYRRFLRKNGVDYIAPFIDAFECEKSDDNSLYVSFAQKLLVLKEGFTNRVSKVIPTPESSIINGVIIGGRNALSEDIERSFVVSGIIHIAVLSGYNVSIVLSAVSSVVFLFILSPLVATGIIYLFLFMFVIITGAGAPIVRASIMASIILLARLFKRKEIGLRILFFTGFLMVLINPYILLYDVSFHLSFLATFGIISLSPYINTTIKERGIKALIKEVLMVTLIAQLFVFPYILYKFGSLSLFSIVTNALVLPLVPFLMLFGFLGVIIGYLFEPLGNIFLYISFYISSYIIKVSDTITSLPFSYTENVDIPFIFLIAIYSIYALLYKLFIKKRIKKDYQNDQKDTPSLKRLDTL